MRPTRSTSTYTFLHHALLQRLVKNSGKANAGAHELAFDHGPRFLFIGFIPTPALRNRQVAIGVLREGVRAVRPIDERRVELAQQSLRRPCACVVIANLLVQLLRLGERSLQVALEMVAELEVKRLLDNHAVPQGM